MTSELEKLLHEIELQEQRELLQMLDDPEQFKFLAREIGDEIFRDSGYDPDQYRPLLERFDAASRSAMPVQTGMANRTTIGDIARPLADHVVVLWKGLIETFQPLPLTAMGMLADPVSHSIYAGVEIPLEQIFTPEVLVNELSWAFGKLRLMCAHTSEKKIRSLRASIGSTGRSLADKAIIISLCDPQGAAAVLQLDSRQPFALQKETALSGDLKHLEVTIATSSAG